MHAESNKMVWDSTCLFKREGYLEKIRGFYRDDEIIKVITGVRRCGKSCLMKAIIEGIKDGGVDDDHITYLDLDRYGFRSVKTSEQLEALIEPVLAISGLNTCSSMRSRTWGGLRESRQRVSKRRKLVDLHNRVQLVPSLRRTRHQAHGALCRVRDAGPQLQGVL